MKNDTLSKEAFVVTVQDVANEAGVSKATVSYVLSNNPLISEKTANRVREAMKKLGYSVNHAARALSTSKTKTIAIVAPYLKSNFFSLSRGTYLYALSSAAREQGYDALLLTGEDGAQLLRDAVDGRKIDGAVFLDVANDDKRIDVAHELNLPVVLLGRVSDEKEVDFVDTDFEYAAEVFMKKLAGCRHKEIVIVGWPQVQYDNKMNYAIRFQQTALYWANKLGINVRMVYANNETLGATTEIEEALLTYPDATALVIHNDAAVLSAPQVIRNLELDVPGDISVVAMVPDQIATGMKIPYTSMCINVEEVVEVAVKALVSRMNKPQMDQQAILVKPRYEDLGSLAMNNN